MKRGNAALIFLALFAASLMALLLAGCETGNTKSSQVERGKYLVTAGGCGDCHSPKLFTKAGPAPDPARLLSGYPSTAKLPEMPNGVVGPSQWGALTTNDMTAWDGPWGVSFAYNLTPHPTTGIGYWTEALFIQSIRNGKFMGSSRDMLPPMPWRAMANFTDEDLKAILAYLKTLPPVDNAIPAPLPPSQE
jgi:mono/diheme cytochrome c family protein